VRLAFQDITNLHLEKKFLIANALICLRNLKLVQ